MPERPDIEAMERDLATTQRLHGGSILRTRGDLITLKVLLAYIRHLERERDEARAEVERLEGVGVVIPTIVVYDEPRGQQRHRTAGGHAYTPTATLEAQRRIRQAWCEAGHQVLSGPVELHVEAVLPRPKGHYGSGRNADRLRPSAPARPTGKPDVDNMLKLVLEALKGVAFRDDAAVVHASINKVYAVPGAPPCWKVEVRPT